MRRVELWVLVLLSAPSLAQPADRGPSGAQGVARAGAAASFSDESRGVTPSAADAPRAGGRATEPAGPDDASDVSPSGVSRAAALLPGLLLAATGPGSHTPGEATAPSRTVRLLGESAAAATAGLVLPFALYGGFTSLASFVGFFAGFLSASVVGLVLGPIAVMVTGGLLGARGGAGRGVLGALLGLVAAVLIGLPLATLPGAGYLVGLGLFWLLPSVGTLIAFEWGREEPPGGLTLLTF